MEELDAEKETRRWIFLLSSDMEKPIRRVARAKHTLHNALCAAKPLQYTTMAKSIRSHIKKKHRAEKRATVGEALVRAEALARAGPS